MKKAAIAIMVVLTSFVSIVHSAQKSNTWYAGGKLGFSQFHDTGWHNKSLNSNDTTHESHLGVGISGGYQMNPFVAVELGYNWMGRIPYKGDIHNGEFKAQGIQLTSKFSYPITHDLDLYTRLGGMLWRTDFKKSTISNHDTGISPVFSGGMEWAVTRNIATRLEYQWISNIGDMNTVNLRPDNSILSLGVSYRFNQNEKSLALISNQDSMSSEEFTHDNNKNFTLKSDILFNFNKMTLKPEGLKALDQLYNQLVNSIRSEEDSSIVVIGFTDRIGSDAYNQDLSEKRAQSVIDYLVYKGIPRNKIFLRGMGKSHSITGTSCDNVQVRSELINCLSPDRRVEIKIVNNKDVLTQSMIE